MVELENAAPFNMVPSRVTDSVDDHFEADQDFELVEESYFTMLAENRLLILSGAS